jgi:hypothetical protein
MQFSLQIPINPTSLGQVATNILIELHKKGIEPNIFPIGPVDLQSFNGLLSEDFEPWLRHCCQKALASYRSNEPSIRLWHINGSHETISKHNFLYFFHELDGITKIEKNILTNYDKVFSPCKFTENVCKEYGVKNIGTIQLGYNDLAFKEVSTEKYENNETVITLAGKYEKRKHTEKMIRILAKNFGGDSRYKVHLHVFNPFYDQQDQDRCAKINHKLIADACGGQIPFNFVLMGQFPELTDLNKCYNVTDICVDGSGGESWSLPSFHMAGLGKKVVAHYNSGLREWAENCYLVDSNGKESAEDGIFFGRDTPFNCGNIFTFDEEEMTERIKDAIADKNFNSKTGKDLKTKFTYERMTNELLEQL